MPEMIDLFDHQFRAIDRRSRELLSRIEETRLFERPRELSNSMAPFSCGEYLLRSAAMVEQTFGGITTRLWDDPFEWTLPEKLSDKPAILQYLDEVESTRLRGFAQLNYDADLGRQLPAPERLMSVAQLFLETLGRANHFQGRAFSLFQMLSDEKLPVIR